MYLVRTTSGTELTCPALQVMYGDNYRTKKVHRGVGGIRLSEMESTGKNKATFIVTPLDSVSARGQGRPGPYPQRQHIARDKLHSHVRSLDNQDRFELEGVDDEIAAVVAQLTALRNKRELVLKAAWRRAGKVSQLDLAEMAEER